MGDDHTDWSPVPGTRDEHAPEKAAKLAQEMRSRPKVAAWMKRLKRLMKEQPFPGETMLYMQENTLNLMVRPARNGIFLASTSRNSGMDQSAVVDCVTIPGADAGAW